MVPSGVHRSTFQLWKSFLQGTLDLAYLFCRPFSLMVLLILQEVEAGCDLLFPLFSLF